MKKITTYACSVCGATYPTQIKAEACERQVVEPIVSIGDIVTVQDGGFGWYDGERSWIKNAASVDPSKSGRGRNARGEKCPNRDPNCFGACCCFTFYYVITATERELRSHRIRYHVETLAMTGKSGYRSGYTYEHGHCTPVKATKLPATVVKDARALIGHKFSNLL